MNHPYIKNKLKMRFPEETCDLAPKKTCILQVHLRSTMAYGAIIWDPYTATYQYQQI